MAFLANGAEPDASTVWYTASWETTPVVQPGGLPVYVARALVGPPNGVVQLAIGFYGIFVKITDNPEAPVVPAGTLKVT